jgi:hypothetical protein
MKLSIVGSRTFNDKTKAFTVLDEIEKQIGKIDLIISGGACGADTIGELYAQSKNIPTLIFLPNWEKYGKSAGFIRNSKIVDNCDVIIGFWDLNSLGTKDSLKKAKNLNKIIYIFDFINSILYSKNRRMII